MLRPELRPLDHLAQPSLKLVSTPNDENPVANPVKPATWPSEQHRDDRSLITQPGDGAVLVLPMTTREETQSSAKDFVVSSDTALVFETELKRVLSSETFRKAPRLKRFLEYAVTALMSGQMPLKEYTVGLEVFDRGASFDPSLNPIVRVEALRLRKRLSAYYATEGFENPYRIDLPKGGYVPMLRVHIRNSSAREIETTNSAKRIMVLPFLFSGDSADPDRSIAAAISGQLIHLLTQSRETRVVSQITSTRHFPEMDVRKLGGSFGVEFIIEGSIQKMTDQYRILAALVETTHGFNLWSGSYQSSGDVTAVAIAEQIAADSLQALNSCTSRRLS
jgi:TolB-like protein